MCNHIMSVNFILADSEGFVILYLLNSLQTEFFPFFLFFLLIRIMYREMLHVFQRVESIHKTQTGFSLEHQNKQ